MVSKFLYVCLRSLSCWKVNLWPSLKSFADSNRFWLFQTSFLVPAEEKHPHSMTLPPPWWGWCAQSDVPLHIVFCIQATNVRSVLSRAHSSTCLLCPPHCCGKLQTGLLIALFQQCLSSCHSSIKAQFVECMTNSCSVDRFSYLSCGSLQFLQSYHGPLGCLSNQCSPCPACQFRCCAILFPFSDDRLSSASWYVKSVGKFFIT